MKILQRYRCNNERVSRLCVENYYRRKLAPCETNQIHPWIFSKTTALIFDRAAFDNIQTLETSCDAKLPL